MWLFWVWKKYKITEKESYKKLLLIDVFFNADYYYKIEWKKHWKIKNSQKCVSHVLMFNLIFGLLRFNLYAHAYVNICSFRCVKKYTQIKVVCKNAHTHAHVYRSGSSLKSPPFDQIFLKIIQVDLRDKGFTQRVGLHKHTHLQLALICVCFILHIVFLLISWLMSSVFI